jgi:hypothetical protein
MSEYPQIVLPSIAAFAPALDGQPADEIVTLGQSAVVHLLSAGLDLNVALTMAGDSAVKSHLRRAIGQIDEAVADVRRLMLAAPGAAADAPPEQEA